MKNILVCGAGGFIGTHLVNRLKQQGHYVIGVDLKLPEFSRSEADEFYLIDLRDQQEVSKLLTSKIDEIYQLAADMGGAGYIFTGENDASIMHNSATINLNICNEMVQKGIKQVFYSSSACMYPLHNQLSIDKMNLHEDSAYPANPDSEYGWEKLFSERLYLSYARNYGLNVRIARFHNIFGPLGSWNNGKEKAPAALCRKVAMSNSGDTIEIWGPGTQTRSFLYIEECLIGIEKIMNGNYGYPLNLGSDRMISINDLALLVAEIAEKNILIKNVPGPIGVSNRNSDNSLIYEKLNWKPLNNLEYGIKETYKWIKTQL